MLIDRGFKKVRPINLARGNSYPEENLGVFYYFGYFFQPHAIILFGQVKRYLYSQATQITDFRGMLSCREENIIRKSMSGYKKLKLKNPEFFYFRLIFSY